MFRRSSAAVATKRLPQPPPASLLQSSPPSRVHFLDNARSHLLGACSSAPKICSLKPWPPGPGTKTFEIDQSFEPSARNRRPTAVGAALKMSKSSMSDEFDSLDAIEKAAVEPPCEFVIRKVIAFKVEPSELNDREGSIDDCEHPE